ncbi:iron donor protein CyaY [Silvimonas iriomotensis]|uniref:Iron-sulfur cluster assembly protein CyaY n=1 Tax=Silvimonas iriomotensis TaxID=449662 RepID=A0ABQ2PDD8_9NEIS|nr:iron donor protein CyaY [Silvimonas iriomotensis]GGP23333.1 protein CyaY [Silvimonas iriomotensis]
MTETEFLNVSDAILDRIEAACDDAAADIDPHRQGNVLELEFEDGSKIIVNRHAANQELWIAARHGGFHYRLQDGQWRSTREEGEFFADLAHAITLHGGEPFSFAG